MSISFPAPAALCAKCHRHTELSQHPLHPQEPPLAQFLTSFPNQTSLKEQLFLAWGGRHWMAVATSSSVSQPDMEFQLPDPARPIPGNTHLQHLLPALQCLLPCLQKVNIFPWNRKLVIVLLLTGLIIVSFCDLFYPAQNQMQLFEDMQSQEEIVDWSKRGKFYSPYFILTLSLPTTHSSFSEKRN